MWIGICRRLLIEFVVALAILACLPTLKADASDKVLRLSYFLAASSSQYDVINHFAQRVKEATNGAVEIQLNFDFPDLLLIRKLKAGELDLAVVQSGLGSAVETFKLFDLPYLVRNREHMQKLIFELIFPDMAPIARESGLEIISVIDGGFRQLYGNRPITRAEQLRGLRIRTLGTTLTSFFQYVGAQPVSLPLSEVAGAMDKNVIDAVDIALGTVPFIQDKANPSIPRYVTITNHVYAPVYIIGSASALRKLDDETRQVLQTVGRETIMYSFRQSEISDQKDKDRIRGRVQVYDLSESEQLSFIEISRKAYDGLAVELGVRSNLIARALQLAYGRS